MYLVNRGYVSCEFNEASVSDVFQGDADFTILNLEADRLIGKLRDVPSKDGRVRLYVDPGILGCFSVSL